MNRDPFAAIADPTRRAILDKLASGPQNVAQLHAHFTQLSRNAISKQVHYLEGCGLVTITKQGREQVCSAQLTALAEVQSWIQQYEAFWNRALDNLEQVLGKQMIIL